jgi:anti-sigma regulatory factor (Ser/Thr protein kinase)
VTNVIRHAEGLVPGAPIALVIEDLENSVVVELMYLGEQYEPPREALESDFAAFPEGGFGLYIIQAVSKNTDYLHHEGVNTVRMMVLKSG